MRWVLIDNIKDHERIYSGACIRFYNTAKSLEEQCALPVKKDGYLDYIVAEIYANHEYLQLTCLTQGEGGNITCVLKKENDTNFITGKEIKRMLQTDLYKVLIHKQPIIYVK